MKPDKPHAGNLRIGRYSAPGVVYFITNNVEQKHPLITPACREIVIDALKWARDNGRNAIARATRSHASRMQAQPAKSTRHPFTHRAYDALSGEIHHAQTQH